MKKLLILGAGVYQLPLIRRANAMGLHTIVCSIPGAYPGFAEASEVAYVNTTDLEGCLALAREKEIDGVITAGTDVALPALGAIRDALGLPGPSLESARLSSDKLAMKRAFERAGVPVARYRVARTLEECLEGARQLRAPWILKVVDSSGSRGVVKVESEEAIRRAFDGLWRYTRRDFVLIEEFIEGKEFGAQALVAEGRVRFVMPHGDVVHHALAGVPVGHYVPYGLDSDMEEKVRAVVEAAIRALGIDNAAVNVDLMRRGDQVYVLETGARSGATCLPELVSEYYGVDFYEELVRMALGESLTGEYRPRGAACAGLLFSEREGVVRSLPERVKHPALVGYSYDYAVGDRVPAFRTGPDRIGQVIARGRTLEEAESALRELKDLVRPVISYERL